MPCSALGKLAGLIFTTFLRPLKWMGPGGSGLGGWELRVFEDWGWWEVSQP